MTVFPDPQTRKTMCSILDDAPDLTIATNRPDGFPQATVVSFVHDDGAIYFGCDGASQKAKNIARDNRVSVTVTPPYEDWKSIRGLSIGARAQRVTDENELARAGALMMKRFPQAAEFMSPDESLELAMFRVDPEAVSILDYAQGFGHTELVEAAPVATAREARA